MSKKKKKIILISKILTKMRKLEQINTKPLEDAKERINEIFSDKSSGLLHANNYIEEVIDNKEPSRETIPSLYLKDYRKEIKNIRGKLQAETNILQQYTSELIYTINELDNMINKLKNIPPGNTKV